VKISAPRSCRRGARHLKAVMQSMAYLIRPTTTATNSTAIATRSSSGKFCATEHHPVRLKLYHFPNRRFRC
jgi:hypothetical protein